MALRAQKNSKRAVLAVCREPDRNVSAVSEKRGSAATSGRAPQYVGGGFIIPITKREALNPLVDGFGSVLQSSLQREPTDGESTSDDRGFGCLGSSATDSPLADRKIHSPGPVRPSRDLSRRLRGAKLQVNRNSTPRHTYS